MQVFAHLKMDNNEIRKEQTLKDHCEHVAQYAMGCLEGVGLGYTAYLSGLLHDMGKAKQEYVNYLEDGFAGKAVVRGSVNHTFAGVIYMLEKYHDENADKWSRLTSEIISCGIGGHHGLFDCADLEGNNGFLHRLRKDKKEIGYEEAVFNYFSKVTKEQTVEKLFQKSLDEIETIFEKMKEQWSEEKNNASKIYFQMGMLVRLVQSAVIYGDHRDAREFMNGKVETTIEYPDWKEQGDFYENKLAEFSPNSPINQVRETISNQCRDFADEPCGIYRLNAPTGGGKTLASLRYALNHAEKYTKKRIIFIIPLLSILDQNAKDIRKYISDQDMVLEHHSNVLQDEKGKGNENEEVLNSYETLTEEWDAPIIVSTLVQFLNILFKYKKSAVKRMQALCDSVIIIDEVQSLPIKATAMFNMALNFLNRYCNATIILSSATQPSLEELDWPIQWTKEPDMIHLSTNELSVFRRAEIINKTTPYGMDWEECTDFCRNRMQEHVSVLIICNTKSEARRLYEQIQETAEMGWQVYHLSTSMCQAHRMKKLEEIRAQLEIVQKETQKARPSGKVICISTQLVEAGVDFSFECVVRIFAGIDNLAQAAGRCNRSNEYGHLGKVYLINLKNEDLKMLTEISRAQDSTRKVLVGDTELRDEDLIGAEAAQKFYAIMFRDAGKETMYPFEEYGSRLYIANYLANENQSATYKSENKRYVLKQPFKTMGEKFQVFDDDTIDILVPYDKGKGLIEQIESLSGKPFAVVEDLKGVMGQAKEYTINVFQYQKEKLEENGLLNSACEGRILMLNERAYQNSYGLEIGD